VRYRTSGGERGNIAPQTIAVPIGLPERAGNYRILSMMQIESPVHEPSTARRSGLLLTMI
ncbi:MAG: hypothetical protein AAAB11_10420, partial [Rhizobium giardinii]